MEEAFGRGWRETVDIKEGEGERGAKDGWSEATAKALYPLPT